MAIHLQGKLYGAFVMGTRESGELTPPSFLKGHGLARGCLRFNRCCVWTHLAKGEAASGVRMYYSIYNESIVTCSSFKAPAICERSAGLGRGRGKGPWQWYLSGGRCRNEEKEKKKKRKRKKKTTANHLSNIAALLFFTRKNGF